MDLERLPWLTDIQDNKDCCIPDMIQVSPDVRFFRKQTLPACLVTPGKYCNRTFRRAEHNQSTKIEYPCGHHCAVIVRIFPYFDRPRFILLELNLTA
jgi:hypothetical protein